MENYTKFIGVDIGGTFIKGMIINSLGEELVEMHSPTPKGNDELVKAVAKLVKEMVAKDYDELSSYPGVGIGCPGVIDSKNGVVVFSGNLSLDNFPLANNIAQELGTKVKITNDANAAALGEDQFGAGKMYTNSVLITLGTGVGSGIVVNGKIYEGGKSAGAEMGHMVIVQNGRPCTCGRCGCWEAYSSASALRKKTLEMMKLNPTSKMWNDYQGDDKNITAKTPFDYMNEDKTAKEIIEWYINHLGCGVTNVANIFRPDVIMLGGGVSNQGEILTKPVQEIVDKEIISGTSYAPVKVVTASLGNKAGVIGAAALWINE